MKGWILNSFIELNHTMIDEYAFKALVISSN